MVSAFRGPVQDLEAAHQVRLESVRVPVAHHGTGTDAQLGGHLARAPVRGCLGLALRGQLHQLWHVDLHGRRATRQITFDAFKARFDVALAPARHLHAPHAQLFGDVLVLQPLSGQQHDACTLRQAHARALRTRQLRQLLLLLFTEYDDRGNSHLLAPIHTEVDHWNKAIHLSSIKNQTLH